MATVSNPFGQDDNNDPNNSSSNQNQGQGQAPTIGGPQGGGTTSGGAHGASSPTPTSSGSFTNIQKYINANQDFNADKGGLAGQVVGNINQQANQVQQGVQSASNAFGQQAQQAASAFNNPDLVNQAFTDPSAFAQDQNNVDKFAQVRDASYTGPKSFQDLKGDNNLSNLQTQSANVNDLVTQGQSENGRFNLLKQMFGNQSYSKGQQQLDNVFLQSNPAQLGQIQGTRRIASDTTRDLNDSQQAATDTAQQFQQQAAQTQADVRGRLNQSVLDRNAAIQKAVEDAKASQNTEFNNLKGDFSQGKLTANEYAQLNGDKTGLTTGAYLYGVDPTKFLTTGTGPSAQTVASKADYDTLSGLNKLMGNGAVANQDASAVLQNFADPSKAGSYQNNYNFDSGAFQRAVKSAKTSLDTQSADMQTNLATADQDYGTAMQSLQQQYADAGARLAMGGSPADQQKAIDDMNSVQQNIVNAMQQNQQFHTNWQSEFDQLQKLMGTQLNIAPATASIPADLGGAINV